MSETELRDKTAWVSGAASGMGAGIAELFVARGAKVVLVDIQQELGQALAERIDPTRTQAIFSHCDVGSEAAVKDSIGVAVKSFGQLDIVVNCAGVVDVAKLEETTEQQWDRLMAINVKSMFFSVKHALPFLRQRDRSYVVNIGSVGSLQGQAMTPAYVTSKHAVLGLSRSIALDYAVDGLRCNCICPGITDTPMFRYHMDQAPNPEQAISDRLTKVPMGVAMYPHDIAKAALYFSCENSAGVTGTHLVVDGGYTTAIEWTNRGPTRFQE